MTSGNQNGNPKVKYTRKDFASDQDVRWCPGCGDYAILAQMQKVMPELDIPKENIVFISGIGCSSRFPYYMDTYGVHSIHGRAPTLASGLKLVNPDLKVFVITGDGDALSIGGNHLMHVLRRNIDLTVVLFNNRIYGLTKGQYSPTSLMGTVTKSSPLGSIEQPLNPLSVALAAEATFVARSIDVETKHLAETLLEAAQHKGASFVEVLQNCNIFNDGAWHHVTKKENKHHLLRLEAGKSLRFGENMEKQLRVEGLGLSVVENSDRDELVFDPTQPSGAVAYALSRMNYPEFPVPIGVFRKVQKPTYGEGLEAQVQHAKVKKGEGDLLDLYLSSDIWKVGGDGKIPEDIEQLKREVAGA
jgi:2-oxoglutarate/2-oxoacid ferredoxin oxidoreductase subunit beta